MPHDHHRYIKPIEVLLRTIPERWHDFDHDDLTATEQQALFLLVAAGLVERRISVKGEFVGQAPAIEFTIDVTGEYGIIEAMEPVAAEMWTKWGPAFESWKASDAGGTTPFRFTRPGSDRWRLTDHGVMARGDLDIKAHSEGSAAFVGSYQRAMEYITRTGYHADRPGVHGEGRLVDLKCSEAPAEAAAMPVSIANSSELAAAFRDLVIPALAEAFRETAAPSRASEDTDEDTPVPPALSPKEATVLRTLAIFDSSELVSAARIESEMELSIRLSARTIGKAVSRLIEVGLAERPQGDRSGTRLTIAGRRLAQKIAD
ncbi:MAG: hypothetical protein ACWA5W_04730 [Phycisphaerales bacterium]